MRRNLEETSDPLNTALLPSHDPSGLDLRLPPGPRSPAARRETYSLLLVYSVAGLGVLIMTRLLAAMPHPDWVLPLLILVALLFTTLAWLEQRSTSPIGLVWFLAPISWLVGGLIPAAPPLVYGVVFGFAMLLALLTAREVVQHYRFWLAANIGVAPAVRTACHEVWRESVAPRPSAGTSGPPIPNVSRELNEIYLYRIAQLIVPFSWGIGYLFFRQVAFPAVVWTPILIAGALFATGFLLQRHYVHRTPQTPATPRIVWYALVSWLTYNMVHSPAHGLLQSPAGSWLPWRHPEVNHRYRLTLTALTVVSLAVAIIPTSAYFPITAWWTSPRAGPHPLCGLGLSQPGDILWTHQPARGPQLDPYDRQSPPELWLAVALHGAVRGSAICFWAFLWSLLLCLLAPALLLYATLYAISARLFLHHYATLEAPDGHYQMPDNVTEWQAIVDRLHFSKGG